jgi:outer membrane protein assembly factor BamB
VFGRRLGTQRQAQMALLILFWNILLEMIGRPFRIVTPRHKILRRLELATLITLWGTMWCGTCIFASQQPGDEGFVVFLSMVVAVLNSFTLLWLVTQLGMECFYENKDTKAGEILGRALTRANVLKERGLKSVRSFKTMVKLSKTEDTVTVDTARVKVELSRSFGNELYKRESREQQQQQQQQSAPVPSDGWTREFDTVSGGFYLYHEETGESRWEEEEEEEVVAAGSHLNEREPAYDENPLVAMEGRFFQCQTEDGEFYYLPAVGDGEALWELPPGGTVVGELDNAYLGKE